MSDSATRVGNLPLPQALLESIEEGRWVPPASTERISRVFGDEPDWPQFYDLETMDRQNRHFQNKSPEDLEGEVGGSKDGLGITPALAVIIGSLGADMPIALDYRQNRTNPRVIYLAPDGWREIAPNFEELSRQLGL